MIRFYGYAIIQINEEEVYKMEGKERREAIVEALSNSTEAITGTTLAKRYGISRQGIVQDIALLRAQGMQIISTSEGYLVYHIKDNNKRAFLVKHETKDIEDELNSIVDLGGNVLNAVVTHPVYGEISVDMMIGSRRNVMKFMEKLKDNKFVPLMQLTGGEHVHIIEADSDEILDEIEKELNKKGYIVSN